MPARSVRLLLVAGLLSAAAACGGRGREARAASAPRSVVPAAGVGAAPFGADLGRRVAAEARVGALARRRFTQAALWDALGPALRAGGGALRVTEVGRSGQGRALRAVTAGEGRTVVLLWSQMHGDESTATMALADLLAWFAGAPAGGPDGDALRARLSAALTVVAVPMLNPDGAERFRRENAAGLDVNRDARRQATPEGRALARLADSLRPAFAFNLHDHDTRLVGGRRGRPVAVSLLAPAAGADGAWGPARSAARLVAAGLAAGLASELPGRVARYDDAYTPDAFGEWMQARGVATVLVEAGALPGDGERQRLRALHVAALLGALDAIATGAWRGADAGVYDRLPAGRLP